MILLASRFNSPEKAKGHNFLAQILSFVIVFKNKVTYVIEMILLCHVFKNRLTPSTSEIFLYAGAVLAILLSSAIEFSFTLVLSIRIRLVKEVPWCAQKSIFPTVKSILKLAQGVCLAVAIP
jgi:hypothetical protein